MLNNFKHLKIRIQLQPQGVMLNRFTTMDSILLATYYNIMKTMDKEITEFDTTHASVDFIKKEHGTFSGSIWYVPEENNIAHDYKTNLKMPDYEYKLKGSNSSAISKSGLSKQHLSIDEILLTDEIYFYVTGEERKIKQIMNVLKFSGIGKKRNSGYGQIKDIIIEEMEEEFGFMLDDKNPSKPLPKEFKIKSNKIASWRRMPPYNLQKDLEACFMPNTSLIERRLKTVKSKYTATKHKDDIFTDTVNLIDLKLQTTAKNYKPLSTFTRVQMEEILLIKNELKKKKPLITFVSNNTSLKCCVTGNIETEGYEGDIIKLIKKNASSFADFKFLNNKAQFISKTGLWMLENIRPLKNVSLVTNEVVSPYAVSGQIGSKKPKEQNLVGKLLSSNLEDLKPPFMLQMVANKKNNAHLLFKNKRKSISNGFFFFQLDGRRLEIDAELLMEAYNEFMDYRSKDLGDKGLPPYVIYGMHGFGPNKKNNTEENMEFLSNFHKKYNNDIRTFLSQMTNENISYINAGATFSFI